MVRVLDVLEHQLPVGADPLVEVAEHAELTAVEDPVEPSQHRRAQPLLERLPGGVERGEHDAVALVHRQAPQRVVGELELLGHAAPTGHALPERQPHQLPVQAVGPVVVRATQAAAFPNGSWQSCTPRWAHRFSRAWSCPSRSQATITDRSPIRVVLKSPLAGSSALRATNDHSGP